MVMLLIIFMTGSHQISLEKYFTKSLSASVMHILHWWSTVLSISISASAGLKRASLLWINVALILPPARGDKAV